MLEALFMSLSAGLSLWGDKESRKYLDRVIKLKQEYYHEFNKKRPDDSTLDNILLELHFLTSSFSSKVATSDPKDK